MPQPPPVSPVPSSWSSEGENKETEIEMETTPEELFPRVFNNEISSMNVSYILDLNFI